MAEKIVVQGNEAVGLGAVRGTKRQKDGVRRTVLCAQGLLPTPHAPYASYLQLLQALDEKYRRMREAEQRWEAFQVEDAELVLVAYGYTSRVSKEAFRRGLELGREGRWT